jgi:hypothetical protein
MNVDQNSEYSVNFEKFAVGKGQFGRSKELKTYFIDIFVAFEMKSELSHLSRLPNVKDALDSWRRIVLERTCHDQVRLIRKNSAIVGLERIQPSLRPRPLTEGQCAGQADRHITHVLQHYLHAMSFLTCRDSANEGDEGQTSDRDESTYDRHLDWFSCESFTNDRIALVLKLKTVRWKVLTLTVLLGKFCVTTIDRWNQYESLESIATDVTAQHELCCCIADDDDADRKLEESVLVQLSRLIVILLF